MSNSRTYASTELTGLLGWAERVMNALGEWGVGVLVLLETVFPPLPSEVVLPLAGFLTSQGKLNMALVIATSTLGAYLGALGLYGLGAALVRIVPSGCWPSCPWSTARTSSEPTLGSVGTARSRSSSAG